MQTSEEKKVLDINNLFYTALGTRDLELMKGVWIKNERAGCVHPGWTILRSWDAIMQSWENVFNPDDQVDIKLSNLTVKIKNNVAWVTCVQEMVYINRDPVMFNISQSTNIFEKFDNDWKMVIHHASPIPIENYEPEKSNIQ